MGWSLGFDQRWSRDIGYGVPATCDHPGCCKLIDRGLAYVCGFEPYGGDHGCGLFFCPEHQVGPYQTCQRCVNGLPPFEPKPDHPVWIRHKATHESWSKWRDLQTPSGWLISNLNAAFKELGACPSEKLKTKKVFGPPKKSSSRSERRGKKDEKVPYKRH